VKRNGFTLVEMLIALSIFGMLTAAGVALLTVTARTQESSDRLLAEVGELRRVGALLGADLAQAAPRIYRDEGGRPRRAFAGASGEAPLLMAFVRRGWDAGDGPALQRVEYRLRAGAIQRLSYAHVDGGSEPLAVVPLIDGVRTLRLRYRDSDGAWRERWDPTDAARLPQAVELITDSDGRGLVRQLFLVASGSR
jgi:general secretion pathway protein J